MFRQASIHQSGFTLIEIITTLVILSIVAAAMMSLFSGSVRSSANPMIQQQAVSVAEAYMEEIMLKSFNDPDGIGGESRANYDDVLDYNGLTNNGARDQTDSAIASLAAYTVNVTVVDSVLNTIPARLITVNVTHNVTGTIQLTGYRTNY